MDYNRSNYVDKEWVKFGLRNFPGNRIISDYSVASERTNDIASLYLPTTIKYIACANDEFVCFVTEDDCYNIKYVKYWEDARRMIDTLAEGNARENYANNTFPHVSSKRKIIGIYSTTAALFALTIGTEGDGDLCLTRWEKLDGTITDPFIYQFKNLIISENDATQSIKFLVSDFEYGAVILLYGLSGRLPYIGKAIIGQSKIHMESVEKLIGFHDNANYLFATKDKKILKNQSIVEYVGVEKNSCTFFTLRLSLSPKEDSKLYIKSAKELGSEIKQCIQRASAIALADINVHYNPRMKTIISNSMLFLAATDPDVFIAIVETEYGLRVVREILVNSENEDFLKTNSTGRVSSLSVLNGQVLVYGDSEMNYWKAFFTPYYIEKDAPKKHYINYYQPYDS